MPNLANAKKALRQSKKRFVANLKVKRAYKLAIKNALKALKNNDGKLNDLIKIAQKKIDKAVKKGVLKKNTGARKLSRLVKKINTQKTTANK